MTASSAVPVPTASAEGLASIHPRPIRWIDGMRMWSCSCSAAAWKALSRSNSHAAESVRTEPNPPRPAIIGAQIMIADDLLKVALNLSKEDRAELARQLIVSLESGQSDADSDELWKAEIERRLAEVDRGEVKLIEWHASVQRIREMLEEQRRKRYLEGLNADYVALRHDDPELLAKFI